MKKLAVYLRVSTDDQHKGLESQEHAIKTWCKNHGYKKSQVTFYRDLGKSGKDLNRPAFKKLQEALFMGEHDTVICWALDRLSRSQKDGINIIHDWLKKDIRIVSISQRFDWSGKDGQMLSGIFLALAQWQRQALSEATKRGLAKAKAKGVKLGKRSKLKANKIVTLKAQGLSHAKIGAKFGVSRQAVDAAVKRIELQV